MLLTSALSNADPYENGTPAWGSEGTPRELSPEGNVLRCDFADSVDWLKPRKRQEIKKSPQESLQKEEAVQGKWCPFTASAAKRSAVSSSK